MWQQHKKKKKNKKKKQKKKSGKSKHAHTTKGNKAREGVNKICTHRKQERH